MALETIKKGVVDVPAHLVTMSPVQTDHEEARLATRRDIEPCLDQGGPTVVSLLLRYAERLGPLDPQRAARTLPQIVRAVTDAWATLNPPDPAAAEGEAVRAVQGYLKG